MYSNRWMEEAVRTYPYKARLRAGIRRNLRLGMDNRNITHPYLDNRSISNTAASRGVYGAQDSGYHL